MNRTILVRSLDFRSRAALALGGHLPVEYLLILPLATLLGLQSDAVLLLGIWAGFVANFLWWICALRRVTLEFSEDGIVENAPIHTRTWSWEEIEVLAWGWYRWPRWWTVPIAVMPCVCICDKEQGRPIPLVSGVFLLPRHVREFLDRQVLPTRIAIVKESCDTWWSGSQS